MAWAFKQSAQSATAAVSAGSNLTAGSLIVVFCLDSAADSANLTCSQTSGTATVGSFTKFGAADNVGNAEAIAGFWAVCSAGGTATFTIAGGTGILDTRFGEWTGQAASPADVMGTGDTGQAGSVNADADKSQSVTTTANGDLLVAYIEDLISSTTTFTKGASPNVWTERSASTNGGEFEEFIQTTAAAIQATWTASSANTFMSVIGSFQLASGTIVLDEDYWNHLPLFNCDSPVTVFS